MGAGSDGCRFWIPRAFQCPAAGGTFPEALAPSSFNGKVTGSLGSQAVAQPPEGQAAGWAR